MVVVVVPCDFKIATCPVHFHVHYLTDQATPHDVYTLPFNSN